MNKIKTKENVKNEKKTHYDFYIYIYIIKNKDLKKSVKVYLTRTLKLRRELDQEIQVRNTLLCKSEE